MAGIIDVKHSYDNFENFVLYAKEAILKKYFEIWQKHQQDGELLKEAFEKEYRETVYQLFEEIKQVRIKLDSSINYKAKNIDTNFSLPYVNIKFDLNTKSICYRLQDLLVELPQKLFNEMKRVKNITTPYLPDIISDCVPKMVQLQDTITPNEENIVKFRNNVIYLMRPILQLLHFLEEENEDKKEEIRRKLKFIVRFTDFGVHGLVRMMLFMHNMEQKQIQCEYKMGCVEISIREFYDSIYKRCSRVIEEMKGTVGVMLSQLVQIYNDVRKYSLEDIQYLNKINTARLALAKDPSKEDEFKALINDMPSTDLTEFSLRLPSWVIGGEKLNHYNSLLISKHFGYYIMDNTKNTCELNIQNKKVKINFKEMKCTRDSTSHTLKHDTTFNDERPKHRVFMYMRQKLKDTLKKLIQFVEPIREKEDKKTHILKSKNGVVLSTYEARIAMDTMYNLRLFYSILQREKLGKKKPDPSFSNQFEEYEECILKNESILYENLHGKLLVPFIYTHNPTTPNYRTTIGKKLLKPHNLQTYIEGIMEYNVDVMAKTSELRTNTEHLLEFILIKTIDFDSQQSRFLFQDAVEYCIDEGKQYYVPAFIDLVTIHSETLKLKPLIGIVKGNKKNFQVQRKDINKLLKPIGHCALHSNCKLFTTIPDKDVPKELDDCIKKVDTFPKKYIQNADLLKPLDTFIWKEALSVYALREPPASAFLSTLTGQPFCFDFETCNNSMKYRSPLL
mmetsp:Transcript_7055/g.10377  ORF Transcript_7055/g.10377 Transcript_7055/m.10377 type:complete len:733 (+) Transcript_7055:68-2266(+)